MAKENLKRRIEDNNQRLQQYLAVAGASGVRSVFGARRGSSRAEPA